jgi:hypothetical protein
MVGADSTFDKLSAKGSLFVFPELHLAFDLPEGASLVRSRPPAFRVVEEPPRRWMGARRYRELARGRRAPDYVGAWRVLRPRGLKMRFF